METSLSKIRKGDVLTIEVKSAIEKSKKIKKQVTVLDNQEKYILVTNGNYKETFLKAAMDSEIKILKARRGSK